MVSGNPNRTLMEVGLKLPKHDKSEVVNEKMHRQLLWSFILQKPNQTLILQFKCCQEF